jgi:hypothetical protein
MGKDSILKLEELTEKSKKFFRAVRDHSNLQSRPSSLAYFPALPLA